MNRYVNLLQYLSEFFSQYEFIQTGVVEKVKIYILRAIFFFFENRADNVAHAHSMATNTHSEYITAARLDEGAAMLSFTYTAFVVCYSSNMTGKYVVRQESNDTECVARQLATL